MKHKIFTLAMALIFMANLWADTNKNAEQDDTHIYYTSSDGAIVTPKKNAFGAKIISNEYKNGRGVITCNKKITKIGRDAFYACYNLTSITIPNSVTSIGRWAFNECQGLTSIEIPSSVTSIENWAFCKCKFETFVVWSPFLFVNENTFALCFIKDFYCVSTPYSPIGTSFNYSTKHTIDKKHFLEGYELLMYHPFPVFAQIYVESHINAWQKKGDFEKTEDWQKRVAEDSRNQQAQAFLEEAEEKYFAFYTKCQNGFKLGTYDPDNEVYLIQDAQFGDLLVPVAMDDAKYVQENWDSCKINPQFVYGNDKLVLTAASFRMPNGKTYTYQSDQDVTYAQTNINYNFEPIDINIGTASTATQPKGQQTIQQKQLTIGKSDIDINIPQTGKSCPNTFAIIVSNENYSQLKEVPCAINDGKVFAQYCEKTIGLPKDNIKLYTNATYGMMIKAIHDMQNIANAYNGDINIIFYYSGHGAPTDDTKEAYLLPVDAFGVAPEVCYSLNKLYKELADMKAQSVTIFLDACFSGATKDGDMLASVRGVAIKAKANAPQGNMVVFSAASDEQTALPYLDMGHGMFTYYLLKKLQETKGDVTYQALGDYVKQEVYRRSSVVGKLQTPTVSASTTADSWQSWKLK